MNISQMTWWERINALPQMNWKDIAWCKAFSRDGVYYGMSRVTKDPCFHALLEQFHAKWQGAYFMTCPLYSTWFMRNIAWPLYYAKHYRNRLREQYQEIEDRVQVVRIKFFNLYPDKL